MPGPLDDETVPADFNVGRTGDRLERAQKRQLDLECRQLRGGDRRKSWIRAARRDSAPFQHAPKRLVRLDMTDAPAELAVIVDGHECAGESGERRRRRGSRQARAGHVGGDGVARHLQQQAPIGVRRHRGHKLCHVCPDPTPCPPWSGFSRRCRMPPPCIRPPRIYRLTHRPNPRTAARPRRARRAPSRRA